MYTPGEIAENYIQIGKKKAAMQADKMFLLAVMAGIYIAVAGCGASTAACTIGGSAGKLIGACVFPAGLTLVLLAGSELFTGNCLLIIPVLKREISVSAMLRNWGIVYLGNLAGSVFVAWMVVNSHQLSLFDGQLAVTAVNTAVAKVSMPFADALLRGVLCNLLVCLAVWVSFAAKDVTGKVIGLFYPILVFVVCGFEHSVANMFYCPAALFALGHPEYARLITADVSSLTWGSFILKNLMPVTLGNILGGAVLVGAVYWRIYLRKEQSSLL
ncbi:MAG: formate/nitrite transporter family protein [Lachnospiraceae bacterium]|nr:formate/nitrite transporter family protein [Lachnospiraceae bacterium]